MKKLGTLSLLVLLVVTLTGCTPKKDASQKITETNNNDNTEKVSDGSTTEEQFSGTLEELIKLGKNYKCTFSTKAEEAETTGEVFISGNKAASNVTIKSSDLNVVANSIMDTEWLYTWNNMTPSGMKIKMDTVNKLKEDVKNDPKLNAKQFDVKEKMDYKCSLWIVDNSKFDLPKNVEFKDTSSLMENAANPAGTGSNVTDGKNSACGACDMAPDEQTKTECRKSLGC